PEWRRPEDLYRAPKTPVEAALAELWRESLRVERVGVDDSFFDLGGNSLSGVILINRLQREIGKIIHVVTLFDAPTVAKMAAYLVREHREAVVRRWGPESLGEEDLHAPPPETRRIDSAQVAALRALVQPFMPVHRSEAKNPSAVFVLSPPRSGSTLLRVMLGGHPRLFSPPELELLSFGTMAERDAAFQGRDSFWLEGAIRAVMAARGCDLEEARQAIRLAVEQGWTTQRFYRQLQEEIGNRLLVDKTPSYALDPRVLRQAEEAFERPFYLHLIRHPYAVIRSFEEASLDQLFFRYPHSFQRTELAELIWLVSHQNIEQLLAGVPAKRQLQVRFEDLVHDPETELRRISSALQIEYHPGMAEPYRDRRARMADGIHAEGRMLGDVKFSQYQAVESSVAERWREATADSLGEPTWDLAVRYGYPRPATDLIVPRAGARDEPFPLSFAQARLWFIDQLEPGTSLYNIPIALRVEGQLDRRILARCLGEIVRRHEALRTVFSVIRGTPQQTVLPAVPFHLAVVDLSGLAAIEREASAQRLVEDEAGRPFDLERGPLLRGAVLRLAPEDHVVEVTLHHIVGDGWSMGILVREIVALYPAFAEGRPSPLAELPVQYTDFSAWQRSWLVGEVLEREIDFWRVQLAGLPALLDLPTDRPRPAVRSSEGASRAVRLSAGVARRLSELSRDQGATLFMALLAGFQMVLARHSGQSKLAVGTPVAGRNRLEIEGLIGFFVNTLVLRGDLAGGAAGAPSFLDLLGRVRETSLAAHSHQDVPFEKLVQELALERSLAYTPLFQTLFTLQNAPVEILEIQGLRLRPIRGINKTAKFDLTLSLREGGESLGGSVEYAIDLFDAATVDRLIGHFERLLGAAVTAPDQPA
ncbi:MAG: condensation domain-containing protein, partial [Acidobacteriota bacterium]